ncbi:MAG: GerMN domain-containing protein, partial [Moorella sp. (in: Bacteria)]|nr:GerMN domain-containing protein [Moorella sp. (in: firmicutes)]
MTQDGTYLVPVTVTFNPTREVSKIAVEKLLAGPQADGLKGVMPEGVKLRDVYLLDNQQTIYVDLTGEFLHMQDSKQAEMAVKALALTLTNLDNIRFVQILVEGQSVPDIQGIKIDNPLSRPDHINSWLKSPDQKGVQVYFSGVNARFLVPLTVALPPGVGENDLPRAAVLALLAGPPPDSGLIRTIWPGTRLLDLKIENGLATVNFSQEVTGYGGGTTAETILLDS